MALTATIYNLEIDLADIDRGVYKKVDLSIARQPSETVEYMLMRVYHAELDICRVPLAKDKEARYQRLRASLEQFIRTHAKNDPEKIIPYVRNRHIPLEQQRRQVDLLEKLNRFHQAGREDNPQLEVRGHAEVALLGARGRAGLTRAASRGADRVGDRHAVGRMVARLASGL